MGTSGSGAIEAISPRKALPAAKRQHRSIELKRQIVEESFAPGASAARVARAHGVNANQVFTWRRLYRQGRLGSVNRAMPGLLAVQVTEPAATPRVTEIDRMPGGPSAEQSGTIQIEFSKARVRLSGSIDPKTLRVVLEALRG